MSYLYTYIIKGIGRYFTKFRSFALLILISIIFISGCKKLIQIPPPVGNITTSQVFSTDNQALAAISGMYYNMINTNQAFSSGAMTIFSGMSADELIPFNQTSTAGFVQFQKNTLISTNSIVSGGFWSDAYSTLYTANSIIEGLDSYKGVSDSLKEELIGEAEFIRAFCNFYLINLFGDVPLVTTINWTKTNLLYRTSTDKVYNSIISDLTDAQNRLRSDYAAALGQRIIPNKWAATALLARVYLFQQDWVNAEKQASQIISNGLYNLLTSNNLNSVFLLNSSEAIWQLQQSSTGISSFYATPEGNQLIPRSSAYSPFAFITTQLLNAFEYGDLRKAAWIDSTIYNSVKYYFPYKYKIGPAQGATSPYKEYYMVLRLSEQYLIRAEAEIHNNESNAAIADLNVIRLRAGLSPYSGATDQASLLNAIMHERQVELFAEWGHRWLDLKRWGNATVILSSNKGFAVSSNSLAYPIPVSELQTDPNLTQNPGY